MPVKSNKKKSSISKKKQNKSNIDLKKYKDRIKELDNQLKNMEDKNVRLLAEFDNYKKRKNSEIDNFLTNNLNQLQYIFDIKKQGDSLLMIGRKTS